MCASLVGQAEGGWAATTPAGAGQAQQAPADGPKLVIESFAPTRGIAVGTEAVELVATVRNAGSSPSVGGVAFGRLYCLAGLDYLAGDTIPIIPVLAPGASATYRWTVRPTGPDNALVVSFSLLVPGNPPITRAITVPHLGTAVSTDASPPPPVPSARAGRSWGSLENTRVRLRILVGSTRVPIGFLWVRSGAGWRRCGTISPLAEVLSGEGTQHPWWEFVRVEQIRVSNRQGSAALALSGWFGLRWRGTVLLSLNAGSGAVQAGLSLSPARPMRLAGIRLCRLLAGDGGLGAAASDAVTEAETGPNTVTAMRWGPVTVGALRPTQPEIVGLQTLPLPDVAGAGYHVVGWELRTQERPLNAEPEMRYAARLRLLALAPTASASDGRRISFTDPPVRVPPPKVTSRPSVAPRRARVQTAVRRKARAAAVRRARLRAKRVRAHAKQRSARRYRRR
jgi:hypothetical protein